MWDYRPAADVADLEGFCEQRGIEHVDTMECWPTLDYDGTISIKQMARDKLYEERYDGPLELWCVLFLGDWDVAHLLRFQEDRLIKRDGGSGIYGLGSSRRILSVLIFRSLGKKLASRPSGASTTWFRVSRPQPSSIVALDRRLRLLVDFLRPVH